MIFEGTTIPKLPEGFVDCSWHNDICSHFEKKFNDYIIKIWIAQDDPEKRELIHQYMVCINNAVAVCATLGIIGSEGKLIKTNVIPMIIYTVLLIIVVVIGLMIFA